MPLPPGLMSALQGSVAATGTPSSHIQHPPARPPSPHQVVVLASPPCQAYSHANTTSREPLEILLQAADKLVAAVEPLSRHPRVVAVVVENPGTGRLLGRKVGGELVDEEVGAAGLEGRRGAFPGHGQ